MRQFTKQKSFGQNGVLRNRKCRIDKKSFDYITLAIRVIVIYQKI